MNEPVGFGVIGANSFVANAAVLPAISQTPNAKLVATASRSGEVPELWNNTDVGSYEAVLEHPDVEVVYIPLPNGMHREWTERAAAAGKHVLCEKPLAADVETAQAMADACDAAGVMLAEAWMTPFHDRYSHVIDETEGIGDVRRIESSFTFTIEPEAVDNYRWDPAQGGGALLDVGIYCLGPIVELFDAEPSEIHAAEGLTDRRVDAWTSAELTWADGTSASISCSFVDAESQTLHISGTDGSLVIDTEAFTGGIDANAYEQIDEDNGKQRLTLASANDSYASMISGFAHAARGEWEWPRPVERSIEMLALIERIKKAARD